MLSLGAEMCAAVLRRGLAAQLLEHLHEMALVVEAAFHSDDVNGLVCLGQQFTRPVDPDGRDIGAWSGFHDLLKLPPECRDAHHRDCGELGD